MYWPLILVYGSIWILRVAGQTDPPCGSDERDIEGHCYADQKKTSKSNYWLGWSYHLESVADNTWISDAIHQVYTDINDGLLEDGSNGFCVDNYCDSIQIMVTGDLNLTVSVSVTNVKNKFAKNNNVEDILRQPFDDRVFDFNTELGSSPVNKTHSYSYTKEAWCPDGYQPVKTNVCGQCVMGWFGNQTTLRCQQCPEGEYQDQVGTISCEACNAGKSTYGTGSRSKSECRDICYEGEYMSLADGVCKECEYGFYQDDTLQISCLPCEQGYTTYSTRTDSPHLCFEICDAGHELLVNGSCLECEKGSYLDQQARSCQPCPADWTTTGAGSTHIDNCSLAICPAGEARSSDTTCKPCEMGWYREEGTDSATCVQCDSGERTDSTGATHSYMCKFFCPGGMYINNESSCKMCGTEAFKPELDYYATSCTNCTSGLQTGKNDSTQQKDCKYAICEKGQSLKPKKKKICQDCSLGTYMDEDRTLSTKCTQCEQGTTTRTTRSTSVDQCEAFCESGQGVDSDDTCVDCERGFYKDNSLDTDEKFNPCRQCPDNFITPGTGATRLTQCDISACVAGWYRVSSGNVCEICPVGSYQPDRWQEACLPCPEESTTHDVGSITPEQCNVHPNWTTYIFQLTIVHNWTDAIWNKQSADYDYIDSVISRQMDSKLLETVPSYRGTFLVRALGPDQTIGNMVVYMSCVMAYNTSESEQELRRGMNSFVKAGKIGEFLIDRTIPSATTFDIGAVMDGTASCDKGYHLDHESAGCEECPSDWYQPYDPDNGILVQDVCVACPTGRKTRQTAAFGKLEDVCEVYCFSGEEPVDAGCAPCARGYYKDNDANAEQGFELCDPCPNLVDYTTAGTGSTLQSHCDIRACEPGSYRDSTSNECQLCPVGEYQVDKWQDQCMPCDPESSTEGKGAVSDAECNVYPNQTTYFFQLTITRGWKNSYWDRESTAFQSLKNLILQELGTLLAALNYYKGSLDIRVLAPDETETMMHIYLRGLFSHKHMNVKQALYELLAAIVDTGMIDEDISIDNGAPGAKDFNIYPVSNNNNLPHCDQGKYLDAAFDTCLVCPSDWYQPYHEDTYSVRDVCVICPQGRYTNTTGLYGDTNQVCRLSCTGGQESSDEGCKLCAKGWYKEHTAISKCVQCPNGLSTVGTGSSNASQCGVICPAGEHSPDDRACQDCPVNTYKEKRGQTKCEDCPDNKITNNTGSNDKQLCFSPLQVCQTYDLCENGGSCVWSVDNVTWTCDCKQYYKGSRCEMSPLTWCEDQNVCMNAGVCTWSSDGPATCICKEGYTGDTCSESDSEDLPIWAIVGGALGGLILIIVVIVGLIYCGLRRNDDKSVAEQLRMRSRRTSDSSLFGYITRTDTGDNPLDNAAPQETTHFSEHPLVNGNKAVLDPLMYNSNTLFQAKIPEKPNDVVNNNSISNGWYDKANPPYSLMWSSSQGAPPSTTATLFTSNGLAGTGNGYVSTAKDMSEKHKNKKQKKEKPKGRGVSFADMAEKIYYESEEINALPGADEEDGKSLRREDRDCLELDPYPRPEVTPGGNNTDHVDETDNVYEMIPADTKDTLIGEINNPLFSATNGSSVINVSQ